MRTEDEIMADAAKERPFSNHSEFDHWADSGRGCYDCIHDDAGQERYCPILGAALLGNWPKEWTRKTHQWQVGDASGSYEVVDECTEFEARRDGGGDPEPTPGPKPVTQCDGQLDIIDAYVDTAVAELSRAPAPEAVSA